MSNRFLSMSPRDTETALLLEKATMCSLRDFLHSKREPVAFTDGNRIFINTDENLAKILPEYNDNMLKWLLWHEKYHMELKHPERYEKYKFSHTNPKVTVQEVNIIMDILVHDSLSNMFPELVDLAKKNYAQMRDNNSLMFKFTTFTLEEMIQELEEFKQQESAETESGEEQESAETESGEEQESAETELGEEQESAETELGEEQESKENGDMSKWEEMVEKIDSNEFIQENTANYIENRIKKLKTRKINIGKLTDTLNNLSTITRKRTYAMPSLIQGTGDVLLKGHQAGVPKLALVFDASGSMGGMMDTFKEIISRNIPHAMSTRTLWFSGDGEPRTAVTDKYDYYDSTFEDFIPVRARGGYNDDGDRTIELCAKLEREGYTVIGVTDGGYNELYSPHNIVLSLKRTILVREEDATNKFFNGLKNINKSIQVIDI